MIARYQRPEIARLFTLEHRYQTWLQVELAVLQVLEEHGRIPRGAFARVEERLRNWPPEALAHRALELEQETHHDVVAFLMAVEERVGEEGRWIHYGLTSSDVVDTAFALVLTEATDLLLEATDQVLHTLKGLALRYRDLVIMGRTHGMFAEPTTLGLKFLGFYQEFRRNRHRLQQAREEIRYGKLSGTVGTNAYLEPDLEAEILQRLGLRREPVATQVVPRDRHAFLLETLALTGAAVERLATEIRLLQRTEVGEVEEPFEARQAGSSAMPHKRNPIRSERLCGLARVLRGYVQTALENVALWHERDISHSSTERIVVADAFQLLYYMLWLLNRVLQGLRVNEARIRENLTRFGDFYYSQPLLLALLRRGAPRRQAYYWVREVSQRAYDRRTSFLKEAQEHAEIRRVLRPEDLQAVVSFDFTRHIPEIFRKVLGSDTSE